MPKLLIHMYFLPKSKSNFTECRIDRWCLPQSSMRAVECTVSSCKNRIKIKLNKAQDSEQSKYLFYIDDELVWVGNVNNITTEVVNLIAAENGCIYRRRAIDALENAGLKWRIAYTNQDLAGISAAVKENLGITVLAKHTVPKDLNWAKSTSQLPALGDVGISLIKQNQESQHAVDKLAEFIQLRLK